MLNARSFRQHTSGKSSTLYPTVPFSRLHTVDGIPNHQAWVLLSMPVLGILRPLFNTMVSTFNKAYRRSNCLSTDILKIFFGDKLIYNFYQISQKEFNDFRDIAITKLLLPSSA